MVLAPIPEERPSWTLMRISTGTSISLKTPLRNKAIFFSLKRDAERLAERDATWFKKLCGRDRDKLGAIFNYKTRCWGSIENLLITAAKHIHRKQSTMIKHSFMLHRSYTLNKGSSYKGLNLMSLKRELRYDLAREPWIYAKKVHAVWMRYRLMLAVLWGKRGWIHWGMASTSVGGGGAMSHSSLVHAREETKGKISGISAYY